MQPPRHRARFPAASTPAREPFLFRCQKSRIPDASIRLQGQGRPALYFQGRSFHPPQRCLHRHLPKPKPRQAHHSMGLCCSPSLLRLTLRSPVYIWVCNCNNGGGLTSAAGRRVSPRFQYSVQSLSGYRFCLIGPYAAARFDKRQKIIFHTSTILRSARFSRMQTTKKATRLSQDSCVAKR